MVDCAGKPSPVQARPVHDKIDGTPLHGTFPAVVLAGDSPEAFNDIAHPKRVTPQKVALESAGGSVSLPPHSLTIVKCVSD